eukprot:TRINITY_DN4616_c0_g1_i4.p1 TRINITY_DN4616_c0_g1~~TRINITY_DN4616_c0_g1_i4.p1  ORF type:complete len:197 (-),score=45.90 TRINITY_DN4616_c0_g1_i4:557-1147(-)
MPNRNSYLALELPQEATQRLHELALACSVSAAEQGHAFESMEYADLHMTFFFMGETLRELSAQQLQPFHSAIKQAIEQADLQAPEMTFDGLDLFPPGKTNLIVAKFAAPPGLVALQKEMVRLASAHGISGSKSQWRLLEETCWTPHCTLGKLRASSAEVASLGARVIKQADWRKLERGMRVAGVIMRGEVCEGVRG